MKLRPVRFVLGFAFFILLMIMIMAVAAGILAAVGTDKLYGIQEFINDAWLHASIVRWIVLAAIIFLIPAWFKKRAQQHGAIAIDCQATIADAEKHDAVWETIQELRMALNNHLKMEEIFTKLYQNKIWVGVGLIAFELVFVQLPHWL